MRMLENDLIILEYELKIYLLGNEHLISNIRNRFQY